ncbi:MAG: response regulator [Streptosporangiaceae bacterium]
MRLVLGDDQAIFLDALSTVLTQRGYDVGAVARSPEEMIAYVRHQRPDACLIDCNLAVDGGLRTIQRVIEVSEATTVVVLGADPDADAAELALDAGASGYLHQSRGVEVLVSALERMPNGERVIDLPDAGPARRPRRASHADTVAATLTGRERECLSLLVAGLDTGAIVAQMGVSRTTVRTHLQSVLTKLGVHSRLEAASFAVRHHLVDAWAEPGLAGSSSGALAGAGAGAGAGAVAGGVAGAGAGPAAGLSAGAGAAVGAGAGAGAGANLGASVARRSATMRRELTGADQRSALRRPAVGAA